MRFVPLSRLLCALVIAINGGSAAAQVSEVDYFGELPEVLTVTRLAQPLSETPGAVTIIDREMIRQSGAREVAELLRLVPGFSVTHFQGGARPSATYHADYNEIFRHLQVFVDGRTVYSSLLVGSANFGMMGVAMEDIERIEVLRGSNSASYGANAFLGVVNIVTRHASDTRGGMVTVNAGEGGVRDGTARVGWGDDAASFRLTAATRRDSGFEDLYDDKRVDQAHFRADLRPSPRDEVTVTAGHSEFVWGVPDAPTRDESWRDSYLRAQWLRQIDATDHLKLSATFDEETYADFIPRLSADGTSRRIEIEAEHGFAAGTGWRFVWGGQYRHEQVVSPDLFYVTAKESVSTLRLFGNAEWRLHPRWLLNFGGLVERHGIVGTSTAPRLFANFHAAPGHTLRLGTTGAYKMPTLFELRTDWRLNGVPLLVSSGGVTPERVVATEVGYLGEFRQFGVVLDVRVFREEAEDLMAYWRYCPGCPMDIVNKDPSTQRGWEAQLRWRPASGTQLIVNHMQLRFIPDATSTAVDDGSRAPRHVSSLALFQRLPHDWYFSVIHSETASYFIVRATDMIPPFRQTDIRLGRDFRIGATRAEAALTARAALGGHEDYVMRGMPRAYLDRRIHATLRLEF